MPPNIPELYFTGNGRLSRATWLFRISVVAVLAAAFGSLAISMIDQWCGGIFALVFAISACALCVQRLHDVGRSGYALLYVLVPVIGPIWLIVQLLKRGVDGRNRYGDNPLSRSGYLQVDTSI